MGYLTLVINLLGGWRNVLVGLAVVAAVWFAYSFVYDRGYTAAHAKVTAEWNAENAAQAKADAKAKTEWEARVASANQVVAEQAAQFEAEREKLNADFKSMEDLYRAYLKNRKPGAHRLDPMARCLWAAANAGTDDLRRAGLPGGRCAAAALPGQPTPAR